MRYLMTMFLLVAGVGAAGHATAQIDVGSDGSDGALTVSQNTVIDLGLAATGDWTTPGTGDGVYDPDKWAVVFKYSSVEITGGTVSFVNHPKVAPVVWLVQGDVTINGALFLSGQDATGGNYTHSEPGPGGFRGGRSRASAQSVNSGGFGPGGGSGDFGSGAGGGSYAEAGQNTSGPTYGNSRILPLIGGSGGGGASNSHAGGAGGGAILIAAGENVTISGWIRCDGGVGNWDGGGSGSGGAIRIIADTIAGDGELRAIGSTGGYNGGPGRIRLEANAIDFTTSGSSNPAFTSLLPLGPEGAVIWPDATEPRVRLATVAGVPIPTDPTPTFSLPSEITLAEAGEVEVVVEANNVPLDWNINLRMVRGSGRDTTVTAQQIGGNEVTSTWSATLSSLVPFGFVSLQAHATQPTP